MIESRDLNVYQLKKNFIIKNTSDLNRNSSFTMNPILRKFHNAPFYICCRVFFPEKKNMRNFRNVYLILHIKYYSTVSKLQIQFCQFKRTYLNFFIKIYIYLKFKWHISPKINHTKRHRKNKTKQNKTNVVCICAF